jgi:formylglycine-generating enzyme required for sulfatase activity
MQRKMMGKSGRVKGFRFLLVLGAVIGVVYAVNWRQSDAEATRLVEELLQAETSRVHETIEKLADYQAWANDDLATAFDESADDSTAKLHAGLALLSQDASVLPFLQERLLSVSPAQFAAVRDLLYEYRQQLIEDYATLSMDAEQDSARRFQAACALATYDPDGEVWSDNRICEFVAEHLTRVQPAELLAWRDALRGVKEHLQDPLIAIYRNSDSGEQERSFATDTLADYLSEDADRLFDLAADADQKQFAPIFDKLTSYQERAIQLAGDEVAKSPSLDANENDKEALAMRQANAAVLLLKMDSADQVWPLLRHTPDPRVRSYIIHRISPLGGDPNTIIARYHQETDLTIKRALLLCLGEFDESELPEQDRASLMETLIGVYQSDPDPGLHSAVGWLLREWGQAQKIASIDKELLQNEKQLRKSDDNRRQWYVNTQGQTFVIFDAGEFQMGSPVSVTGRSPMEEMHGRRIGRRLAISTKEVTQPQWRIFDRSAHAPRAVDQNPSTADSRTDGSPMVGMTWYEAAEYCNWLSEQEGIPQDQWCYEPHKELGYAAGMKAKEFFWELTGYRLPTEAEWEFACRAGTKTSRYYGQSGTLLPLYAWYQANDQEQSRPVGSLKPNDFGLFDMQGNVSEWCYDAYDRYPSDSGDPVADAPGIDGVQESVKRVLRGGPLGDPAANIRSAFRDSSLPVTRSDKYGFRPVRTYRSYAIDRLRRAHALTRDGKYDEAVEEYRESIKELPITSAHFGLANALRGSGEFDEARVQYQMVLQRLSKEVGEENFHKGPASLDGVRFSIASVYVSLAGLEGDAGNRKQETTRWRTLVDTLEKKPDSENPDYWSVMGQGLYRLGRIRESRQAMEKAIALRGETEPPMRGGARWWYLTMALGQFGEIDKAWQYYDQLIEEMWENPSQATIRYQAEAAEILGVNPWVSTGEF